MRWSIELRIPVVLLLVISGMSSVLRGEEIVLTTGEVLQGEVVEFSDEAVTVDHPVLGRLVIPRAGQTGARPGGTDLDAPSNAGRRIVTPCEPWVSHVNHSHRGRVFIYYYRLFLLIFLSR